MHGCVVVQSRLSAAEQVAAAAKSTAAEAATRAACADERLALTEQQLEDAQVCEHAPLLRLWHFGALGSGYVSSVLGFLGELHWQSYPIHVLPRSSLHMSFNMSPADC